MLGLLLALICNVAVFRVTLGYDESILYFFYLILLIIVINRTIISKNKIHKSSTLMNILIGLMFLYFIFVNINIFYYNQFDWSHNYIELIGLILIFIFSYFFFNYKDIKNFFIIYIVLGTILSIIQITLFMKGADLRSFIEGYHIIDLTIGASSIILIYYFLINRNIFYFILTYINFSGLLLSIGTTMVIMAPFSIIVLWIAYNIYYKKKKLNKIYFIAFVCGLYLTAGIFGGRVISRIDKSIFDKRLAIWENPIDTIVNNPLLGKGFGEYIGAHNMFLEIGAQTGIMTMSIILLIFIIYFINALKYVIRAKNMLLTTIFVLTFVYFVNWNKSFTFFDSRTLFVLMAFLLRAYEIKIYEKFQKISDNS